MTAHPDDQAAAAAWLASDAWKGNTLYNAGAYGFLAGVAYARTLSPIETDRRTAPPNEVCPHGYRRTELLDGTVSCDAGCEAPEPHPIVAGRTALNGGYSDEQAEEEPQL